MKTTAKILALVAALTAASQGSTTISGTVGTLFKDATGTANIASGDLCLLVVDTTGSGFLNQGSTGAITSSLTGKAGETITVAQAGNLTVGSTFGGNTIISTFTSSGNGSISSLLPGAANFDITPYVNKNFALVWFTTANPAASLAGQAFGEMRLSNWTLPAADGGTYTMSNGAQTGTTFYSIATSGTNNGLLTATQTGAGFFTGSGTAADSGSTAVRSAQFSIVGVPEPSAAILGAFGVLGLLRRRRN